MKIRSLLVLGALLAWLLAGTVRAAEEDVFAFIPSGGRTLLIHVFQGKPGAEEVRGLLTGKHSRSEWIAYLQAHRAALTGLQKLSETELLTLADYLSFNMPLAPANVPADPAKANWDKTLPWDGKELAMEFCQSCHIITVVVTQDKTREAWLGTMHKPSHIGIKLTEPQREALASYLVLNANIPIDLVPEDLRAGGATY